jgi:hypothetical protein
MVDFAWMQFWVYLFPLLSVDRSRSVYEAHSMEVVV